MVAGLVTHSLVILTASYINLYKILEVSLVILHHRTQARVTSRENEEAKGKSLASEHESLQLFDRICTYHFKRLPTLGSFVNNLFLMALLMSAAIEGIQTCFHVKHLSEDESLTKTGKWLHDRYSIVLAGFAIVGLTMQWCCKQANDMLEKDAEDNSTTEVCGEASQAKNELELNPALLLEGARSHFVTSQYQARTSDKSKRHTICLGSRRTTPECKELQQVASLSSRKLFISSSRFKSCDPVVADDFIGIDLKSQISVTSLKMSTNLESPPNIISSIPAPPRNSNADLEAAVDFSKLDSSKVKDSRRIKKKASTDFEWELVRVYISPLSLLICAIIVYIVNDANSMVTEVADASLAILVVTLLFTASYPPMKAASKLLLQSAPDEVDLELLMKRLQSIDSQLIKEIRELHVWSLSTQSGRVGTCHIVIHRELLHSKEQLGSLVEAAKQAFLAQNIRCSAVQPEFFDNTSGTNATC